MKEKVPRVLLISKGDCDSFQTLYGLLEGTGCEVLPAPTATAGFGLIRSREFDLVVLDWSVGDPSGTHLCRALRALLPRTPIYFFSYIPPGRGVDQVLGAGASCVFSKPDEIGALLKTITPASGTTLNVEALRSEKAKAV